MVIPVQIGVYLIGNNRFPPLNPDILQQFFQLSTKRVFAENQNLKWIGGIFHKGVPRPFYKPGKPFHKSGFKKVFGSLTLQDPQWKKQAKKDACLDTKRYESLVLLHL